MNYILLVVNDMPQIRRHLEGSFPNLKLVACTLTASMSCHRLAYSTLVNKQPSKWLSRNDPIQMLTCLLSSSITSASLNASTVVPTNMFLHGLSSFSFPFWRPFLRSQQNKTLHLCICNCSGPVLSAHPMRQLVV